MAIKLSSGFVNALQSSTPKMKRRIAQTDISLGDGDGTGGLDTINSVTTDLSIFPKHSFLSVVPPDPDPNANKYVKVLSSSTNQLEVAAGSFTAYPAGGQVFLVEYDIGGSIATIMQNSHIRLFNEAPPASANDQELGTPICEITLNGNPFQAGVPLNGLNFGLDGLVMKRATDPETGAPEIHQGNPTVTTSANSFYWYANDLITGASISSIRIVGAVTGGSGGGDLDLKSGNNLTIGIPVQINEVRIEIDSIDLF